MIPAHKITGVILAGGKSTRMGTDKALLALNGKPFIQHVAEAFQNVFTKVVISANTAAYDFLLLPVLRDVYPDCGPLGGIHSALMTTAAEAVFFCSCDTPFMNSSVIRFVVNRPLPDQVTLVLGGNCLQPLCGVYKRGCLPVIEKQLKRREYSVQHFIAKLSTTILSYPPENLETGVNPLMNINTPIDYEQCVQISREMKRTRDIIPKHAKGATGYGYELNQ